jgi:hypothetical protein
MAYNRNKRNENDKFYTKEKTVLDILSKIELNNFDVVIEPSAGGGAFTEKINHTNLLSFDIAPESKRVKKQNWLEFDPSDLSGKILVVGNPPFGNQGTLALKFLKKAADIGAETIAFILPKSFKKDTIKNKIPLEYHLIYEMDLPDDSFTLEGNVYKVPCVFQIWNRLDYLRELKVYKKSSNLFEFVNKSEADFAFRRVGFYAGRHYLEVDNKSEQSHYFIKSKIDLPKLISAIDSIEWEHNNTAGPKSIGKGELIERLEKHIYMNL